MQRVAGPCWAFRWIGALWAAAPGEAEALGPLLFQFDSEPHVLDTQLQPVADAPGRRVLYEASPCKP